RRHPRRVPGRAGAARHQRGAGAERRRGVRRAGGLAARRGGPGAGGADGRGVGDRPSDAHPADVGALSARSSGDGSSRPWAAVTATVVTMSATVAPRDRSLTGLRSPCSTGPTATAPALRWTPL